ncbi:hypothetical protein LTR95_011390 [Oleoguttula sp. CCFEE 5521]
MAKYYFLSLSTTTPLLAMDCQVDSSASQQSCRGLVRVSLRALVFEDNRHRSLSEANVTRLQRIYDVEGCQRHDPNNFIDIILDREDADHVYSAAYVRAPSSTELKWSSVPHFPIDRVTCLTGLHRIRAAERYLAPNDEWWIARLLTSATDDRTRMKLAEQYSNERAHGDGEIFFKIRTYHQCGDHDSENRSSVDLSTVEKLQTLAPRWSSADALRIERLVDDEGFFPKVSRNTVRNTVLSNIKRIDTAIPSIFTFFEDIKYLEPCARIMRLLLPGSITNARNEMSIQLGLRRHYFPDTNSEFPVEYAQGDKRSHRATQRE